MKSPKYYWLIGVGFMLLLAIGYSISDALPTSDNSTKAVEMRQLVDSRMAIIDKNATARSVIKNMMIDETTKITVLSGTALALSDYVLAYSNKKKHRGYLDLTHLTLNNEGSYVLWSKSPSGIYKRMRVFPPNSEFLQYDIPTEGHTLFITQESAGVGKSPNLNSIVVEEQSEQ